MRNLTLALFLCLGVGWAQIEGPPVTGHRITLLYEHLEVEAADWEANSAEGAAARDFAHQLIKAGKGVLVTRAFTAGRPQLPFSMRWGKIVYAIKAGHPEGQVLVREMGGDMRGDFPSADFSAPLKISAYHGFQTGVVKAVDPLGEVENPEIEDISAGGELSLQPSVWQLFSTPPRPKSTRVFLDFARADILDLGPAPAPPADLPPQQLIFNPDLRLEWIELDLPILRGLAERGVTRLPGDGLYEAVHRLVKDGQASVSGTICSPLDLAPDLDSFWPRPAATVTSQVRVLEYPVEFSPIRYDANEGLFVQPAKPGEIETRRLGFQATVNPLGRDVLGTRSDSEGRAELCHTELEKWRLFGPLEWNIQRPDFHSTWIDTSMLLPRGKWYPLGTLHSLPTASRPQARMLVFARLDDPATPVLAPDDALTRPEMLRVEWEILEIGQDVLATLLNRSDFSPRGPEFRQALGGIATVVDTGIASVRSGMELKLRSWDELMYPQEFEPPVEVAPGIRRPAHPRDWGRALLGPQISLVPRRDVTGWVKLSYMVEWDAFNRMISPVKGQPAVLLPETHRQILNSHLVLRPGELTLIHIAVKPGPEPAPAWVWFARVSHEMP